MTPDIGLRVERRGPALVLTLDRPERRNALTVELVRSVADAVAAAEPDVRGVVITGSPPAFCSGGDLQQLSEIAANGALEVSRTIYGNFQALVRAIRQCPAPVVAAVNGSAYGAGLDLTLVCDLRIASPEAEFTSSWVRIGLVTGMGGSFMLPRLVGSARAAEALLLGRSVSAERALEWGLVTEVVPASELLDRARAMVDELAALPAYAVTATKASLRRAMETGLDAELDALSATQGILLADREFLDRTARFRR